MEKLHSTLLLLALGASGCSLLVDIGAHTANVLFVEPDKLFSRTVAIGGHSISSAIAREFGEPLTAAEFRKKRESLVNTGGATAADIMHLANEIRARVEDRFGIRLIPEPVFVGFDEAF